MAMQPPESMPHPRGVVEAVVDRSRVTAVRALRQSRRAAGALGASDFESLCRDLQRLLDVLDPTVCEQYVDTPQ
jgi:hypothetical protein